MLGANLALVAALVGVGVTAHSLAVFGEGADYLADAAAIGVSLVAINLSSRLPTAKHPNGYPRATRLAAAVNAGWLLVLSLAVAITAAYRLVTGEGQVRGLPVLVVSGVAAVVMLGGAVLLGGGEDGDRLEESQVGPGEEADDLDRTKDVDLNVRAVLLDTAADSAAAAGVAVTGAVIFIVHGVYWLDSAVALVIAVVVAYQAQRLLWHIRMALHAADLKAGTGDTGAWR